MMFNNVLPDYLLARTTNSLKSPCWLPDPDPGQEIVWLVTTRKITNRYFYTLVFVRIKQMRNNVSIGELQRCR